MNEFNEIITNVYKKKRHISLSRFNELIERDNTYADDAERKSLFTIIAGNDELWSIKESIYDFEERLILPEVLETGICISSKKLLRAAFSLYNSFQSYDSLIDYFAGLDDYNYDLLIKAINIRFNKASLI